MKYYLGPWVWVEEESESYWQAPTGTVGLVDLRKTADQGQAGIVGGVGFFATTGDLGAGYTFLGEGYISSVAVDDSIKDAWEARTGFRPSGSTLLDLLWEQLTTGSDVEGINGVRPLMPNSRSDLEIYLGGHSLVRREKFVYGFHPHTAKVKAVLQSNYRNIKVQADKDKSNIHRKVLDFWREKYNIQNPQLEFIPDDLPIELPIPHSTTITESFDKVDGTTLGPDLTWTEVDGDMSVVSNQVNLITAGSIGSSARAESDLSSTDHYSQVIFITSTGAGTTRLIIPLARFQPSGATPDYYGFRRFDISGTQQHRLEKRLSNIITVISGPTTLSFSLPETLKTQTNGSAITGYIDGVQKDSATDTGITDGVRTGIRMFRSTSGDTIRADNFEAADITGAATVYAPTKMMMGMGL